MAIFNTDILQVMRDKVLSFLRLSFSINSFLSAFAEPLNSIKTDLLTYKSDVENRLKYNSQTCYLRAYLNDTYDNDQRRIYIEDMPSVTYTMINARAEDSPTLINSRAQGAPEVIYRSDRIEYNSSFIVFVPAALNSQEAKIIESVNKLRLVTKNFVIEYI